MNPRELAEKIYRYWGVNTVPTKGKKPATRWREWASRRMTRNEFSRVWSLDDVDGVAVVTGQYLSDLPLAGTLLIIDVDDPPPDFSIEPLLRDGVPVVRTRRGFHIHYMVDTPVEEIRLYHGGREIGEGAGLKPHLWNVYAPGYEVLGEISFLPLVPLRALQIEWEIRYGIRIEYSSPSQPHIPEEYSMAVSGGVEPLHIFDDLGEDYLYFLVERGWNGIPPPCLLKLSIAYLSMRGEHGIVEELREEMEEYGYPPRLIDWLFREKAGRGRRTAWAMLVGSFVPRFVEIASPEELVSLMKHLVHPLEEETVEKLYDFIVARDGVVRPKYLNPTLKPVPPEICGYCPLRHLENPRRRRQVCDGQRIVTAFKDFYLHPDIRREILEANEEEGGEEEMDI